MYRYNHESSNRNVTAFVEGSLPYCVRSWQRRPNSIETWQRVRHRSGAARVLLMSHPELSGLYWCLIDTCSSSVGAKSPCEILYWWVRLLCSSLSFLCSRDGWLCNSVKISAFCQHLIWGYYQYIPGIPVVHVYARALTIRWSTLRCMR